MLVQTSAALGDTFMGDRSGPGESRQAQPVQLERAFEQLPEMQRLTLELFISRVDLREISKKPIPLGNSRHTSIVVWNG